MTQKTGVDADGNAEELENQRLKRLLAALHIVGQEKADAYADILSIFEIAKRVAVLFNQHFGTERSKSDLGMLLSSLAEVKQERQKRAMLLDMLIRHLTEYKNELIDADELTSWASNTQLDLHGERIGAHGAGRSDFKTESGSMSNLQEVEINLKHEEALEKGMSLGREVAAEICRSFGPYNRRLAQAALCRELEMAIKNVERCDAGKSTAET